MARGKHQLGTWLSSRAEDGLRALNRFLAGEELSENSRSALDYLSYNVLHLERPLETYAPRTRRRYLAGARQSHTAKDTRTAERTAYQQSRQRAMSTHNMTPSQWRHIDKLRTRIIALGVDADPYMDDHVLDDFALLYGYGYLAQVLTQQIDSTEHYLTGNRDPGRARWDARGSIELAFGASAHVAQRVRGTDPYYYYHGRHI